MQRTLSPDTSDGAIEQELVKKGLNAPRVTGDLIESKIIGTHFHRLTEVLTVCVLTLQNGFTVTGESACASPANFDEQIGNKLARADAIRKIWALEGYLLKEQLYHRPARFEDRVKMELGDLHTKIEGLRQFLHGEQWGAVAPLEQARLERQFNAMNDYANVLQQRLFNKFS